MGKKLLTKVNNSLLSQRQVWIVGAVCFIAYIYLAIQSSSYASAQLPDLLLVSGVCAFLTFGLWGYCQKNNIQITPSLVLGFAVLFRLAGVFAFPILEDDFYRYLWDGRMWVEYGTPYGIAPAELFNADDLGDRFEEILGSINYPGIATIYGPVCQWLFALAYWIAPGQVWPLQVLFASADLVLIGLLLRLTSANHVLLYAWSPLIIKEFAFSAHPDVVGAMFLIAALLAAQYRYKFRVALLLALAVGVKIFALILVPFLLRWCWRSWLTFVITLGLLSIPFGLREAWLPDGLSAMASSWLFNAPIYLLLQQWFSIAAIKYVLLSCFVLIWSVLYLRWFRQGGNDKGAIKPVPRADWLYAVFFLALPVLNAWYLVWLLPFAAIYPSRWAWTASVFLLLSYATGLNLGAASFGLYQHPTYLLLIQFGVIALAALWDIYAWRRRQHRMAST